MIFLKNLLLSFFIIAPSVVFSQKTITYDLPYAGKVSLNIYDENGKLVRELLHTADRYRGKNRDVWDLRNNDSVFVAADRKYTWKILLSKGIQSKYIMSIGPTFPVGNKYWEVGLGNHIGVSSVAIDDKYLYVASGMCEGARSHIKMDKDGKSCIQSGMWPGAWTGFYARTIIGEYVYGLTQEGMVLAHHKDSLNGLFVGVGQFRQSSCSGIHTGFGWSARWPSEKELPVFQCNKPASGNYNIWEQNDISMDIANVKWNNKRYIIVSYALYDAIQLRDPLSGEVIRTFIIKNPKGVAGDDNGNMYVASVNSVMKINCNDDTRQIIASSLVNPYRVDLDVKRKELFVVESLPSAQVKKFSFAGKLIKAYGRKGGRRLGIYLAKDLFMVSDICADGAGGFFITELFPVTRLARFKADGSLIKEWYGGTSWSTLASADNDDPSVVWLQYQRNILLRCKVDYNKHTWKIHSVYNTDSIAAGIFSLDTLKACGACGVIGAGDCNWQVRKRNHETYLVFKNAIGVLKLDTVNWKLNGCVSQKFVQDKARNTKVSIYAWTDINGDGKVQDNERSITSTENYIWAFRGIEAPAGFDYYWYSQTVNAIVKLPVERWTSAGVPVYKEWDISGQFNKDRLPVGSISLMQSDYFSVDPSDNSLLAAINYGEQGWANVTRTKIFRFNADGRLQWKVGENEPREKDQYKISRQPKPKPGKIRAIKSNIGVANGAMIATDYEGGWNEPKYGMDTVIHKTAVTYAWDRDGLYIGDVFDSWDPSAGWKWKYQLSSENGAGCLYTNPKTGDVYYFGGAENEVRVYLLTGWKEMIRLSGTLDK